ncbi:flagellar basal-body rod protein FlgG [Ferrimonas lipolytica]|uniref:Flagellar basal-body rod protein FlgG n=1 Tax=Ferrimonas lipolytica TaxID=2724191 RepID=A0A6H1UCH7_9GAMM|nr:flagellar basal-body rod protein FlgG [Ferrimonas lipolytica]QIZ76785.1 flagellar basal-body rod protein FlgG [Ferrimonas lipolytica]
MSSSLWISKTGLAAQDAKLQAISNNLANVNTTGFKRDRIAFTDLFYQVQRQPGGQVDELNDLPSGTQMGTGVKIAGSQKVFTTGALVTTDQQLDLAIEGQGFFQVEQSNGELSYTRDGQFFRNADGMMVTSGGLPLIPEIAIPEDATAVTIGEDGTVTAEIAGQTGGDTLGQINTVNFINPAGLEALGGNLYAETDSSGVAVEGIPGEQGLGRLQQGALESSNVSVVEEMVEMISTQRAYEMNAKVMSASDEMMQFLNQTV